MAKTSLGAIGALILLAWAGAARAETTPLVVGQPLARIDRLVPATHRYVRYRIQGDTRSVADLWTRKVSLEPHDGRVLVHMWQRWDKPSGPVPFVEQDSWFEPKTLRPLTHVRRLVRDGKPEVGGYEFHPTEIVGLADLADNARKDFHAASPEPAYNFEYDMELLQALPLKRGYAADIVFYDPGLAPPAHYVFNVEGEGAIAGADGRPVDCWIVTADYNTGKVVARFWFAKRSQVMIREESVAPDGSVFVKALLPPESADG